MSLPQTLPGFREFYPEALARRRFLFDVWRRTARVYGFQEFDGPVLESLELFTAKSGDEIEQQLFSFTDKGGREVALRPEMTPTLARMVGAKAASLRRPIKWFNLGENYRYERQQKGRLRAFFQFNADIFGETGAEAEIELIALLIQVLTTLGLDETDFCIRLSDRTLWTGFLADAGLEEQQIATVLVIIDKMEREPEAKTLEKLRAVGAGNPEDLLSRIQALAQVRSLAALEETMAGAATAGSELAGRLEEWRKLLHGVEAMSLSSYVQVDLGVVRGLAYYTGFVFEAFDRKGEFRAIAGGGRYDNLVQKLGGPDLPAVGFAMGDVVLSELLAARDRLPDLVDVPDVYVIAGAGTAREAALRGVAALRLAGVRSEYALREFAFGKQFKQAGQSGARLAVIFGEDEVARGVVKIRDLMAAAERDVATDQLIAAVREHLSGAS